MSRLRKLLCLPGDDLWLLLEAFFILGGLTLWIRLMPPGVVVRSLIRLKGSRSACSQDNGLLGARVAWALGIANEWVPGARCLSQAVAARILLARRGQNSRLHIGVISCEQGRICAHAWVENHCGIVVGALPELCRFTPLLSLDE